MCTFDTKLIALCMLTPSDLNVLVVDDDEVNLLITATMLTQMGLTAVKASTGEQALEEVENRHFDLVLMDLEMPGIDGTKTTREIRKKGYNMPIMAMSAYNSVNGHSRAHQAGIRVFIRKPIDSDKITEVLELLTEGAYLLEDAPVMSV